MLSEEQIVAIAVRLNERVDLPFIGEEKEQEILEGVMNTVNERLGEVVGEMSPELSELWDKLGDGSIDDDEAAELVEQLTHSLNEKIDIPLLDEDQEADMIIRPALEMMVKVLREKVGGE